MTSQGTLCLECISNVGFYRLLVNLEYEFGLHLSMMLKHDEVHKLLLSSRVSQEPIVTVVLMVDSCDQIQL
jgi:hypothetical protein